MITTSAVPSSPAVDRAVSRMGPGGGSGGVHVDLDRSAHAGHSLDQRQKALRAGESRSRATNVSGVNPVSLISSEWFAVTWPLTLTHFPQSRGALGGRRAREQKTGGRGEGGGHRDRTVPHDAGHDRPEESMRTPSVSSAMHGCMEPSVMYSAIPPSAIQGRTRCAPRCTVPSGPQRQHGCRRGQRSPRRPHDGVAAAAAPAPTTCRR